MAARETQLTILKSDLGIINPNEEITNYLEVLLGMAEEFITTEGIKLQDTVGDNGLVSMYAAYLYRKRAGDGAPMPRMLRFALNNRLLSEREP